MHQYAPELLLSASKYATPSVSTEMKPCRAAHYYNATLDKQIELFTAANCLQVGKWQKDHVTSYCRQLLYIQESNMTCMATGCLLRHGSARCIAVICSRLLL